MTFAVPAWVLWLGMSNIGISVIEYVYRTSRFETFFAALPYIIVPILLSQWGLYNGFAKCESLILAGATFTAINLILRIIVSYYIGEHLNCYNFVGLLLFFISLLLIKIK